MGRNKYQKMVVIYKELDIKEEKVRSFFIQEKDKMIFQPGNYLYKKVDTGNEVKFSIIFIQEIREYRKGEDNPMVIEDNTSFVSVSDKLFLELDSEIALELENANVKKIKKLLKKIISEIKWSLYLYSNKNVEARKSYLIEVYCSGDYNKLLSEDKWAADAWLKDINSKDLDFYQEINMHRLKSILLKEIEINNTLTNIDKIAISSQFVECLENAFLAIEYNGKAKRQMDSYIGIDVDYKNKELIWGYTSPCEVRIEFSFFWRVIKDILSLTYVPAILLLLDNEYKLVVYGLLMVVYLIAIWFSDTKHTDKLLVKICKEGNRISYGTLYYWGLMISLVFLLFSLEMVIVVISDWLSVLKFLFVDIVGAYSIILVFNFIISMYCWIMTKCRATRFHRQYWGKVKSILMKIILTLALVIGVVAGFDLLNIQAYFKEDYGGALFGLCVFIIMMLTSFLGILNMWMVRRK